LPFFPIRFECIVSFLGFVEERISSRVH